MKNKRILAPTLLCACLFSAAVQANSMDPVSHDEIAQAKSLTQVTTSTPRLSARRLQTDTAARTAPALEFLRVEAHRFDKSEASGDKRWADVTFYDYATDELVTKVVDLSNEAVLSTQRSKNMQPPLAAAELTRALGIVFDDVEERRILNAEYQRITGETLSSTDQLNYKAFTFFADSMPTVVNAASKACGAQRCAQLVLYTHDNVVFEVSPIVNLSAGVVTQRMGY